LRILQYLLIRLENLNRDATGSIQSRIQQLKEAMYDVYDFDPMILINMFHLQSSETLKNLTPELLNEIKELSKKSLAEMVKLFQEGVEKGIFINRHPNAMADILWSLFSGVVLWETSKNVIDPGKDYLKDTLETAFEIFSRGINKKSPESKLTG